jgi:hypothetical protein
VKVVASDSSVVVIVVVVLWSVAVECMSDILLIAYLLKGPTADPMLLCAICIGIIFPKFFFSFGATAPIWVLAYLHETLRFTSVY